MNKIVRVFCVMISVSLCYSSLGFANDYEVLYDANTTWHSAKDDCETRGGHLATISSQEEDDMLTAMLLEAIVPIPGARWTGAYIGLSDEAQEGVWKWVTGEPLVYTNWDPGEPFGPYDYVAKWMCCATDNLNVVGAWNDLDADRSYHDHYICEYECIDQDNDGLCDSADNCPSTPNGPTGGTCTPDSDNPEANCTDRNSCLNSCTSNGDCSMGQEDMDVDGIGDVCDNCPTTPNGPEGGTCSAGTIGDPCTSNGNCGCEGECSMDQEDADSDGIGDICDNTNTTTTTVPVSGEYIVIDVSGGSSASSYPVTELSSLPTLTDEYKTTKILLRKITSAGQTFNMGSPADETGEPYIWATETQHQVTLTKNYYIGVFEITQRQYELVMGTNPSWYPGDMRPVEIVSWNTIRGGIWPGDPAGSGQPARNSFMDRLKSRAGLDFDLPTEAQWEYACRANTIRAYNDYTKNGGEGSDCLNVGEGTDANLEPLGRYLYNGGEASQHAVVGSYQANLWGLYDMHGNVGEFCLDQWGFYTGDETDPVGPNYPAGSSGSCVVRGGEYDAAALICRSAGLRTSYERDGHWSALGFRLCLPQ